MKPFPGFPARPQYTGIPALFFTAVLPQIDDLAEVKVSLHILWLLNYKRGYPRCVAEDELLADRTLMDGLAPCGPDPATALRRGLAKAVARGTLLKVDGLRRGQQETPSAGSGQVLYLVNSPAGQRGAESIRRGETVVGGFSPREPASAGPRPSVYQLYEEHIGLLAPLVAEKLKDLESEYPEEWIANAIRLAVERNKKSLSYIEGILRRWRDEGKDDGEPGQHPEEGDYTRAWQRYRAERGR